MIYEIKLQRLWHTLKQTVGVVTSSLYRAWSLEDEPREKKVMGETRIPAKRYRLVIQEIDTPLTIKHRESYNKGYPKPWFDKHIMLEKVLDFTGVYIHVGNDEHDTDACLLFGDVLNSQSEVKPLTLSTPAIKRFYDIYYPLIKDKKNEVYLTIYDEAA